MAEPLLSLLFALFDVRGDPAAHLRSWTHEQTLPRDRYQVVVTSAADDPEREAELRALLAPHDVFERAPGVSEVGLYDVAASRASAPWLFLTEAHCLGDRDCLAATARAIEARPELDVATMTVPRVASNQPGRLGARWFDKVYRQWDTQDWRFLPLAGYAVRAEAYRKAGGLDARYGLFAAPLLSVRLDELGVKVGKAEGARIVHIQPESLQEHHHHSADFAEGEFRFRSEHDPLFCESYFGHARMWGNRLRYRPEVARPMARGLLAAASADLANGRHDARWMLRELAASLPAATGGSAPHVLRDRLALAASEQLMQRLPLRDDRLYPLYLRAQDRVVRLTQLRWIRDHVGPPGAPARKAGRWSAETVDGGDVVGAHGLERHDGRWFRWTEPVTMLRVAPPAGEHVLEIDTAGLRGPPLAYVRAVCAGSRPVPSGDLAEDEGKLVVKLSADAAEMAAEAGVCVLARPLEPRRHGSPDRRRLGLPIFSIELRPAR